MFGGMKSHVQHLVLFEVQSACNQLFMNRILID